MQLKDSLTGALKPVVADSSGTVSIYACGITPYSSAHVGHARTYVVFDLLARTIAAQGQPVRLVRNITDIDDKIIAAAKAAGVTWRDISDRYSGENRQMMAATGLAIPEEPKASEYLDDIFWLIEQLHTKGLAYLASTGDVLYRVGAFQSDAVLMHHKEGALRSQQGSTRVDAQGKEDLRDFALWKRTAEDEPGFPSPWGWGRPGWHIECSAMIRALFGGSVAIHGGGVDLKFPHHQAEIMQSEPVFERPLADVWMHNGSVLSDGRKMSKSEGNFVTWRAALDAADALAPTLGGQLLAYSLLQAHWQKPMDWTQRLLETARDDLFALTEGLDQVPASSADSLLAVLDDNLNTPAAMVWLKHLRKEQRLGELVAALKFFGVDAAAWAVVPRVQVTLSEEAIETLQQRRRDARAAKNWALADALRDELKAHGVEVQDTPVRKLS
jgi:cysteinyl-tRNA synthetase